MRTLTLILVLSTLAACASRPQPLPPQHAWSLPWGALDPDSGQIVGIPDELSNAGKNRLPADTDGDGRPNYSALVISGGGAKGAFSAGVLKGWSANGSRPEFTIVTGVSTGALMATWAFLGPRYDSDLERFYTRTTDDQVFRKKSMLLAPFAASLLDTTPLREALADLVDERLLEEVANEYRKGRRLYVASTDLDNGRLVVWDLGAIAASDRADKLERYREVLRASAAIPVGFPPVYFPIEVEGKEYGQMHVDGGAVASFFLSGFVLDRQRDLAPGLSREGINADIYLLMNSYLLPQPEANPVEPRLISIAVASSWATFWSARTNMLARTYQVAKRIGANFHLAGIPDDYPGTLPQINFDPETMMALFRYGEARAQQERELWLSEPPGIDWREKF